jgi:hypothetical protein
MDGLGLNALNPLYGPRKWNQALLGIRFPWVGFFWFVIIRERVVDPGWPTVNRDVWRLLRADTWKPGIPARFAKDFASGLDPLGPY